MIEIELKDDEISRAFDALSVALSDMSKPMNDIGQLMVSSTKDRMARGESPDGSAFAPRSPVTIAAYDRRGQRYGAHPLWMGGDMRQDISHGYGPDRVEIGSGAIQAAMMQFGGTKSQFPHLWGDIPARPFLGWSDEDKANVRDILSEWLEDATRNGRPGD